MLPTAGVNRVFGLLDLLKAYNGKTDIANLTIDLRIDLDELLPIIDTAEYLGLVAVQQSEISLTELGTMARFVSSKYGPTLDIPALISILISWGVFTGLFGYDGQSERLLPKAHVH